jgi:hypothetical protein
LIIRRFVDPEIGERRIFVGRPLSLGFDPVKGLPEYQGPSARSAGSGCESHRLFGVHFHWDVPFSLEEDTVLDLTYRSFERAIVVHWSSLNQQEHQSAKQT